MAHAILLSMPGDFLIEPDLLSSGLEGGIIFRTDADPKSNGWFALIQIQGIEHKREELFQLDKIYISKIKTYGRLLKQPDQSKL